MEHAAADKQNEKLYVFSILWRRNMRFCSTDVEQNFLQVGDVFVWSEKVRKLSFLHKALKPPKAAMVFRSNKNFFLNHSKVK